MADDLICLLLIDDDEDYYLIIREHLLEIKWKRFELEWISSYETGLVEVHQHRHDIYLVDYRLGPHNGLTLLREAVQGGCQAPLILLTGLSDHEVDLEAMTAGAADYLDKGHLSTPLLERSIRYALERNRTLETLRDSEERFRRLVQLSPETIGVFDEEKLIYINPAGLSLLKATDAKQLSGEFLLDHVHPSSQKSVESFMKQIWAGELVERPLEIRLIRLDQKIVEVQLRATPINYDGQVAIQVVVSDITERKQAEQAIRRRNQELSLLNQIIAGSAADLDPISILEMACRGVACALNITRATVILLTEDKIEGTVVAEYVGHGRKPTLHQPVIVKANPYFQYLLSQKSPLIVPDVLSDPRFISLRPASQANGTRSMLVVPLVVKEDVIGSLALEAADLRGFSTDDVSLSWGVADQMAWAVARARLTQVHQRLITVIEQATESVMVTDTQGVIVHVNPAFERVSGYSQAEATGQTPRLLKSGKHEPVFYEEMWTTISHGLVWRGRMINKKKDGSFYTEDATITPVRDAHGVVINYVAVKRDITTELQLEEKYLQSQKMEAIGRLTGGIAHDFNNLLTAINGFAELIQMRLPADDPLQDLVGKVSHSGRRAADLVRQLLTFSHKQIIAPKVLDLNEIVSHISSMLRRIIGEDVDLKTNLTSGLWLVKIDPTQLEQVIVNLAVNARDAMPDGGVLTIKTTNVLLKADTIDPSLDLKPGGHVVLSVSDTGVGMAETVKQHIFEPFFTTKEIGKGTGLGLSTVFGIVKQNGGDIQVNSHVGQGTIMQIYLRQAKGVELGKPIANNVQDMPSGNETILLAEDDPGVRELARLVLIRQGYHLLEAQNGWEALRLFDQYQGNIHLLLTDVVMPGLNGKALAEQLTQSHPHLKKIFMSGYADDTIAQHGVLDQNVNFLPKPFNPTTLAHKVRAVLDS